MRNPLGVVARAIQGRSSGFGWRGGAMAAEPAGVRCSRGWGALQLKQRAQKHGEEPGCSPSCVLKEVAGVGCSAASSGGGASVELAEGG